MSGPHISGLMTSLEHLLPSVKTSFHELGIRTLRTKYIGPEAPVDRCGVKTTPDWAIVWLPALPSGRHPVVVVKREGKSFSAFERNVMRHMALVLRALVPDVGMPGTTKAILRIASHSSFENLLVAHFMRRATTADSFWTAALVLDQLQELALRSYEGSHCTSGFLYITAATQYLANFERPGYAYSEFTSHLRLSEGFFSKPASYRYVDGRNALFVVDQSQFVTGIIRCTNPTQYSRTQRANFEHLMPLMDSPTSKVSACITGENRDVDVVLPNRKHLRWTGFHWHVCDRSHIEDLLAKHGLADGQRELLINTLFAISNMRMGTAVLIPDDPSNLPPTAGKIDNSSLDSQLRSIVSGRTIVSLAAENGLVGLLTSDGLTTISKSGDILACGQIIRLTAGQTQEAGGGRTQAAMTASKFGVAIKVSEDGPITLYRNGNVLLRYSL